MFNFKKKERLCSKKIIDELFIRGKQFIINPYKIVWEIRDLNTKVPAQIAVSVPKRNIKKAIQRNLIKRRIKEAYRLNNHLLYKYLEDNNIQIAFMIVYIRNDIIDYKEIESKLILILKRLIDRI